MAVSSKPAFSLAAQPHIAKLVASSGESKAELLQLQLSAAWQHWGRECSGSITFKLIESFFFPLFDITLMPFGEMLHSEGLEIQPREGRRC